MAWNGSNSAADVPRNGARRRTAESGAAPRPVSTRNGRRLFRGVFAALVVVVLAALGVWMTLCRRETPRQEPPRLEEKPRAVEPTKPKPVVAKEEVVEEEEDRTTLEWHKKHDKRYFVPPDAVRRPNGRLYTKSGRRILEDLPARTIRADKDRKIIFDHPAERQIERLLSIEPGKIFVGNGNYGPKFVESFRQSLVQPTLVTKDDDDETKAMKRLVNEVKADLRERMDAGEDITKIMKDTEQELRALAAYRENLKSELAALRFDESVSEADYADYVASANKLLKDRGMKGLSAPVFVEGQLKYLRERRRAIQAQKQAQEGNIE